LGVRSSSIPIIALCPGRSAGSVVTWWARSLCVVPMLQPPNSGGWSVVARADSNRRYRLERARQYGGVRHGTYASRAARIWRVGTVGAPGT
jgi:hypothetical protein